MTGGIAWRRITLAVCVFGFGLCLWAYYPGLLSPDALAMQSQARTLQFSDWHAVMLPLLWAAIGRVMPDPLGMLLLLLAFYWGSMFVLVEAVERIDARVVPIALLVGFLPFTINFVGKVSVDVLLATSWLLCAVLCFSADIRGQPKSLARHAWIWLLFLIGGLARPNSLFAAIPLGLYLLPPRMLQGTINRGLAILLLPAVLWLAGWTLTYPVLHAVKEYPLHSIITFDLAGVSHFTGSNHIPGRWTAAEDAKIVACYKPQRWNPYAWGSCGFVHDRLRTEKIWGSSNYWRTWFDALEAQPLAYLRHRFAHYWQFVRAAESIFPEGKSREEVRERSRNVAYSWLQKYVYAAAHSTPMFRPIVWLVIACGFFVAGRRCRPAARRFVEALSLSSQIYLLTYLFVGVASDFRYAYWAVCATSVCAAVLMGEAAAALRSRQMVSTRSV